MPRLLPKTDVERVSETLDKLTRELEKLTSPPFHLAEFLEPVDGGRARVVCERDTRVVSLCEGLTAATLLPGHEVFLNESRNCIVSFGDNRPGSGDLAVFQRFLGGGRAVVTLRDAEVVVQFPGKEQPSGFRHGDLVRVSHGFAFERVAAFEPELPSDEPLEVTPAMVAGQDKAFGRLLRTATALLIEPERAARYGLGRRGRSILLSGPPGCGKTLMAAACSAEVRRLSGQRCRFVAVKPGEFDRKHVGEGEALMRATFQRLREAAARDGRAILYLDELDGIGTVRGQPGNVHGDRYTSLLLACIDGVRALGSVLILSSCNAPDRVDPALLERLSAVHIRVPRPGPGSAREIFGVHLPTTLAFSPNGDAALRTRDELIDAAASRLCGPQAEAVCTVRFRSGREEVLHAGRFLSGRLIQQVCTDACERAFHAESARNEPGLRLADILDATEAAVDRLRTTVTSNNIRAWADGLPEDQAIAAVEPAKRLMPRAHLYLNP